MSKNKSGFIPVHEPDLDNLDYKSVLSTLKKGEISGSFTNTINLFEKKFAINMIEIAPKFVVDKRCGKILEKCVLESEMPATYYTLDEIASKMQKSPLKMKNAIKKLQDAGFMASPTSLNPTGFRTDCRIDEILKLLS